MEDFNVLEHVKQSGEQTRQMFPGDTDAAKARRAIEAYELGYLPLRRLYSRKTTLQVLDGNGGFMFGASERHIRRVQTIREKRPKDAARLERLAINGELSLELVEWFVNHPPTFALLEALFLMAAPEVQRQFADHVVSFRSQGRGSS